MLIKRYTFKKSHPRQRLGTNPKQLDPLLIKPSALTLRNCNRDPMVVYILENLYKLYHDPIWSVNMWGLPNYCSWLNNSYHVYAVHFYRPVGKSKHRKNVGKMFFLYKYFFSNCVSRKLKSNTYDFCPGKKELEYNRYLQARWILYIPENYVIASINQSEWNRCILIIV